MKIGYYYHTGPPVNTAATYTITPPGGSLVRPVFVSFACLNTAATVASAYVNMLVQGLTMRLGGGDILPGCQGYCCFAPGLGAAHASQAGVVQGVSGPLPPCWFPGEIVLGMRPDVALFVVTDVNVIWEWR